MTRILITGIAGHLGSRFASWLLDNVPGVEIAGIDNLSCGYRENVPAGVELHQLTLGTGNRLESLLQGVDYAFHFAAYAAEGLSPFIRRFDTTNNLLGTIEVINACLNVGTVRRIVFTSSMGVYGHGRSPFDERDPRAPADPYAISKAACEQHLECAKAIHGQDYVILRPHNLMGPYQSGWQVFRNVLAHWMVRHLQGLPILVYGDGQQRRAFSYIDDVLPCFWHAAIEPKASGEIINLGGETPITIRGAAELLCDVMGGGEIRHAEPRKEVVDAYCTVEKSVRLLGFEDKTPLRDSLTTMWDWMQKAYRDFPERRGKHKVAPIEVDRGLYSFWREYV